MSRRGDNIHRRKDGRWEARFIERYTEEGKACYKSIYARSYTEVKEKVKSYQKQELKPKPVTSKTVDEVCHEWLESISIRIKQSTYALYYARITKHIIPYFKNINVSKINNDMVNRFIREKSEKGRLDNKGGLSPKTINDLVSLLNQILLYAQKKVYISGYVPDLIKPKQEQKELTVLTKNEQKELIRYLQQDTDKIKLGVLISLYTGIRLGELCALKWSDIDIPNGTLKIDKTIQRIKNTDKYATTKTKVIIDKPKSSKSVRTVPIPSFLHEKLWKQRNRYWVNAYVLSGTYMYVEPRIYQKHFKRVLKEANIKEVNYHALRHTYATRAIESGIDVKTLSEILGHSNVKFTLERYVHSSIELKKESVERLAVSY
jgi:integrase